MTTSHEFDPLVDEQPSRYVVGIDLGTTNSAVAYVDTQETPWQVRVLPVPQFVAAGQIESRETLPSFHYQGTPAEGSLRMPWHTEEPAATVGFFARDQGGLAPGRLIASAKSWLCHSGVDRTAELLPWQGAADVDRLSPVEVTSRYLRHMAGAWNAAFVDHPLAEQHVVITLPASFDEVARELTVPAAAAAGLPRVVLIEEPQAAFYAWVYCHANNWEQLVEAGETILICDIGGGTTDFTLIRVRASEREAGKVQFQRVAVGNHLILGGDNLDLALAHHIEQKLGGKGALNSQQWDVLVRTCSREKESMLRADAQPHLSVNLPGSGAKLIGGGIQVEVDRDEVIGLLVEGFSPPAQLDDKPLQRQSGFREFGLPYAPDHGITRYLAAFLKAHGSSADDRQTQPNAAAKPDIVLFNGGFFASPLLRERLLQVVSSWFQNEDPNWQPRVLENDRLDLAVARGAAYYGMVQRGEGVRIAATLARSYYIGVESDPPAAICLVPGEAEAGVEFELADLSLQVTVSEPVEFPLYVSSTRLTDRPGDVVAVDPEQLLSLPPIRTVLRTSRRSERGTVPVRLHARLSEIGTIELWCSEVGSERTWRLQFDIRSATQTDIAAHQSLAEGEGFVDEAKWEASRDLIRDVFAPAGNADPAGLMKRLSRVLEMDKSEWPTSLLRRIWEMLLELEAGRQRSAAHESRWLNLLGYALRPGYGFALDDWRVAETWRTVRGKLCFGNEDQSLILWRRAAGGLSRGQQLAIAEPSLAAVRAFHRRFSGRPSKGNESALNPAEAVEFWRLLGSLELLPVPVKIELGEIIVELLPKKKLEKVRDAMAWTLGRIGQRVPVYGPLNSVVPAEKASAWLHALMLRDSGNPTRFLAAMQLARRSDDRHRDLAESDRRAAAQWIRNGGGSEHLTKLIIDGGGLDQDEQNQVVGETLPRGLRML